MSEPEPNFDPLAPYPTVAAAASALNAQDWPSFRSAFINLDWIGRTLAVRGAQPSEEMQRFLAGRVEQDPGDVLSPTVLASVLIDAGWAIRTRQRAEYVSQEQFQQFHDHLRRAEMLLVEVCARDPGMVAAWELRLKTARGLELGQSEARRRYDQLSKHHPHHLLGQQQYLQQVCPKWSGSYEKAHAFGQECLAAAPPGSLSPVVVAEDVIEHWSELPNGECASYVQASTVQAELRAAAAQSVFHPSFERGPGWVVVMSTFACAFSLAALRAEAATCFRALGPYAHEWGWQYLKDGAQAAFARNRTLALKESA